MHEMHEFLAQNQFGRLACAKDSQPYVTPLYFAYHEGYLHSFATVGQKIEWMRANPRVCVEVDEVTSPQQWKCVIVLGHFEELPHTPEYRALRDQVRNLLARRNVWWEPGYAKTILRQGERPLLPVFFRVAIEHMSGRIAIPENSD